MKVLLHFIGKSTYDEKLFKKEAKKYGANRALPKALALKLKPNDIILLAFKTKQGAKVIGYMVVNGYTLPSEITKKINKENIKWTNNGRIEIRGCGIINITSTGFVKDWDKLIEDLKKIKENFKIFVHGKFYEITPFILNKKFTMSGTWIDIDKELPRETKEAIIRVYNEHDYKRKQYTTEEEKRKLTGLYDTIPLTRWLNERKTS